MTPSNNVAGIDGCRGGWIIATPNGVTVIPNLQLAAFDCIGIDMPIGLIDETSRACDVAARLFLGRSGSSVFPAPPRATLECADYRTALATARAATGRGISKQTFNITRKAAELDRLIDVRQPDRIIEIHPECSFRTLNGDQPLPPKKSASGQAIRRRLLDAHFDLPSHAPSGSSEHDMLDAYAVLWSTLRYVSNNHRTFGDGQRDCRGIEMRIVC